MESFHKIEYYFQNNPQYNIALDPYQTDIGDLMKEAFSLKQLVFLKQGIDVFEQEEAFMDEIRQMYMQYTDYHQSKYFMKDFIVFWLENDQRIQVSCKEYESFEQIVKIYISRLNQTSLAVILQEEEGRYQPKRPSYLIESTQDIGRQSPMNQTPLLTVQFNQTPQSVGVLSNQISELPSKSNSTFQQSIFAKKYFDDILILKKRLRSLFNTYNRKHYKNNTSLTFDQIPSQVANFNLSVWMMFSRDFGFLKTLKKTQVHGLFKKYSEGKLMSFQLFEIALIEVFKKIFPGDKKIGWRMLSIDTDENYHRKMKEMGIPYLQNHIEDIYSAQAHMPIPDKILVERKQLGKGERKNIISKSQVKRNPLAKQKINTVQSQMDSPISFEVQADDKIFMKQYRITKHAYIPFQNMNSPSAGLLKRLDERIKKYVNV